MSNTIDDDPLNWPEQRHLTRDEAARYARALGFRMQPATLAKHAWRGDGPVMTFFGSKPYYVLADFRAWLLARTRRSRSTTRRPPAGSPKPNASGGSGAANRSDEDVAANETEDKAQKK